MVPSLIQVAFIFLIPESPRWLITKERNEEAYAIIAKYHAEGNRESEFVKAEFAQLQATISIELEHSKKSMVDLVRTSGNRRRLLISTMLGLFTQWSGNTRMSNSTPMLSHYNFSPRLGWLLISFSRRFSMRKLTFQLFLVISYFLGDILEAIGQTDPVFKQKINVAVSTYLVFHHLHKPRAC